MRFPHVHGLCPVTAAAGELVNAHAVAMARGSPGLDALLARYDLATAAEARDLFAWPSA